jgi:riboflavin synthase
VFTGLIRYQGQLRARSANRLRLECPSLRPSLSLGQSIAVNGACLTVAELHGSGFSADLLAATLRATTLGLLPLGAALNLELALGAGDAMGGHFVQGHVDGVVQLLQRHALDGGDWRLEFELPEWLRPLVIDKGSLAIDGVSLTVQELGERTFAVAVIPTTWNVTNLGLVQPGHMVNIEADMIVKAVRRTVEALLARGPGLDAAGLRQLGYGE